MALLKIVLFTLLLLVGSWANATLITEDDYIVYEHKEATLAWAWASNYSVENYSVYGEHVNELYAADSQDGWDYATAEEISYFLRDLSSSSFFDIDAVRYKTAIHVFNDNPSKGFSISDFDDGFINFADVSGSSMDQAFSYYDEAVFDTFYVNRNIGKATAPKPIPEPLSILIFATALIILQSKLRKKSI